MTGRITSRERVAIRRGPNDPRNANGRPGSSHILDDHRLAERLPYAFSKNASNYVGWSPGRKRHNNCDWSFRIGLCSDDALKGQLRDSEHRQL
jgi:hypothetical protein